MISDTDCKVCLKPDAQKPAIFRGEPWCCDDHRKVIKYREAPRWNEKLLYDTALMHHTINWRFMSSNENLGVFPQAMDEWVQLVVELMEEEDERAKR